MGLRALLPAALLAATCWLLGLVGLAAGLQLWDAEGLSARAAAPAPPPPPPPAARLLADLLEQDYALDLPARARRGQASSPPDLDVNVSVGKDRIYEVNKCCPQGMFPEHKSMPDGSISSGCGDSDLQFKPIFYKFNETSLWEYNTNDVAVSVNDPCQYGKYKLEPLLNDEDKFYLLTNGSLYMPDSRDHMLGRNDFCMDIVYYPDTKDAVSIPFICFQKAESQETDESSPARLILIAIVMLLSVPFLVITAVAYRFTPELYETYSEALSNHCFCLATAFLSLAITQLVTFLPPSSKGCMVAAYVLAIIIQLAFFCCFAWLTIMCFDIYQHIRTKLNKKSQAMMKESTSGNTDGTEMQTLNKRGTLDECENVEDSDTPEDVVKSRNHLGSECTNPERCRCSHWYSIFGWFLPLLLVVGTCAIEYAPRVPLFLHRPNFGSKGCWFQTDLSVLMYFYGPIATSLLVNFILFVLSVCLWRRPVVDTVPSVLPNGHTSFLGSSDSSYHATTNVYKRLAKKGFILSLMMGLSWSLEVISWVVGGNEWRWVLFDLMNAGQGFIIFYIYMKAESKQYFYNLLRKWFPNWSFLPSATEDPDRASEMTSIGYNGNGNHIANV